MGRLDAPCFASISRSAQGHLKIGRPRMAQERGGRNFPRISIGLMIMLSAAHGTTLKSSSVKAIYPRPRPVKTFCLRKREERTVEPAARSALFGVSVQGRGADFGSIELIFPKSSINVS